MAYDEDLANRIRTALGDTIAREKAMFGGLAFLVGGNMAVAAASKGSLMVRCDPAEADAHCAVPGVARMVMRGKEMDGWLLADRSATGSDAELQRWVDAGVAYAGSLPPK